ncbi:hypothetical protein GWK47_053467 [Chionoecetes opilio]|uniref:Uncharacterized protein n=1 Tax=Chionoecetes opilio TaxID=41210 RepID=A0A8J4YAQ3_CHIOP|nr:hypothetical protein GWK47_053467 [Chionoecetes opilio]
MPDDHLTEAIRDSRDNLIAGLKLHLSQFQPRDDYRELLELSVIVSRRDAGPRHSIRRPWGSPSRPVWVAKLIYAVKIYLFRGQANLTARESAGILRYVKFIVSVYVPAWYAAPSPTSAPANDLAFLKDLVGYEDKSLAKALGPTTSRDATCGI